VKIKEFPLLITVEKIFLADKFFLDGGRIKK
jgi:hypothetical protein